MSNERACADRLIAEAMQTARSTISGYRMLHSSTCMPPNEPPITPARRLTPSCLSSRYCTFTMSPMVIAGKEDPYGRLVRGSMEPGPVVPMQPPRMFAQTTKKRFVSMPLPGPIIASHHPGFSFGAP